MLTGETGAGKSIVVDALLLVAGSGTGGARARARSEPGDGSSRSCPLPPSNGFEGPSIDFEAELVVWRVIGADEPLRAYLNRPVVPTLRAVRNWRRLQLKSTANRNFGAWWRAARRSATLDQSLDGALR